MSDGRIPLSTAKSVAERFIRFIEPACSKISIAGSVRRESEYCGDVEVCAIAKDEFSLGKLIPEGFPGLVVNGSRLKRFKYPESGIQIELYIVVNEADWGRILAVRTGSSFYSHTQLAMRWNRLSWAGTVDGLRKKTECIKKGNVWKIKPEYKNCPTLPPPFNTEEDFFAFLSVPWVHPRERSWVDKKGEYNYNV